MADQFDAESVGMDTDLVDGAGAVSVACGDRDGIALLPEAVGDLGDARRFACAVDTDESQMRRLSFSCGDVFVEIENVVRHDFQNGVSESVFDDGVCTLSDLFVCACEFFSDGVDDIFADFERQIAFQKSEFEFFQRFFQIFVVQNDFLFENKRLGS